MNNFYRKYKHYIFIGSLTLVVMFFTKFANSDIKFRASSPIQVIEELYVKSLKPLFSSNKLTDEDVFNFALYNYLPVDKQENKVLSVNYSKDGFQEIKIDNARYNPATNNYKTFMASIEKDTALKSKLKKIINRYRNDIYKSFFINPDKNTYAVNPEIHAINQLLKYEILNLVKPDSVNRQFVEVYRTKINKELNKSEKDFILFCPDTVLHKSIKISPTYIRQIDEFNSKKMANNLNHFDFEPNPKLQTDKIIDKMVIIPDAQAIKLPIEKKLKMINSEKFVNELMSLSLKMNDKKIKLFHITDEKLQINDTLGNAVFEFNFKKIVNMAKETGLNEEDYKKKWQDFGLKIDSVQSASQKRKEKSHK